MAAHHKLINITHGHRSNGRSSPEYVAWMNMKSRCTEQHPDHAIYFDKGITVCDQWANDFQAFFRCVGPRPSDTHSIDRYPDRTGNYEPGNVRWATPTEQSNNLSSNRILQVDGKLISLSQAAKSAGLNESTVRYRLDVRGMTVEQALGRT